MKKNSMAYDTAVYSLWFGLNYGSILTACALYKTLEQYGKHPALLQKQPALWGEHYAEKDNIAGCFAYQNCDVLRFLQRRRRTDFKRGCAESRCWIGCCLEL